MTFNDEASSICALRCCDWATRGRVTVALLVLRRLVPLLRVAFPQARLRVRLDGGFACPEVFDWLEDERLEYVVAMGNNSVLARAAEPALIAPARGTRSADRPPTCTRTRRTRRRRGRAPGA